MAGSAAGTAKTVVSSSSTSPTAAASRQTRERLAASACGPAGSSLPIMIMALGIFGANYLFADGDYYRFVQKEDWSTAAGYVANFAIKDDLVLFNSNFVEIPFDYSFETYEDLYSIQVEKYGVPQDLFDSGILEPKMAESDIPKLVSLVRGHNRVWLVYSHDSYTDPMGLIPEALAAQKKLIQAREFHGGQVQLYETP
jgi:hypothetical protein